MSLEEVHKELAEHRASNDSIFWTQNVVELVGGIRQLYLLRNKFLMSEMEATKLAQRKLILDLVIKMMKNELKKAVSEMVTAQQLWEAME
jgi:hypothetical protein